MFLLKSSSGPVIILSLNWEKKRFYKIFEREHFFFQYFSNFAFACSISSKLLCCFQDAVSINDLKKIYCYTQQKQLSVNFFFKLMFSYLKIFPLLFINVSALLGLPYCFLHISRLHRHRSPYMSAGYLRIYSI